MARCIDADKFAERIKVSPAFRNIDDGFFLQRVVIDLLNNMPTADVVPKSEVENLKVLLEMTEKAYEGLRELYRTDTDALVEARIKTETEVAREIFEEIETSLFIGNFKGSEAVYAVRAEDYLHYKKKYTEDKE